MTLDHQPSDRLTQYLHRQGWLADNEAVVAVAKPGEGNMNFVARVTTERRSFIIKQAYPWVYKYPQVTAPVDRGAREATFYRLIASDPVLTRFTPTMLGYDAHHRVLAQEDLGSGADFTFLYDASSKMTDEQLRNLLRFLSHLHRVTAAPEDVCSLENRTMRQLNHEHIFRYPFAEDNGLDLDAVLPGLQSLARTYRQDTTLKRRVDELGALYLQNGTTLLHGDYYPGSWLRVAEGVRVIDPEFGFFGTAEFDVGVMLAHAMMTPDATYTPAQVLAYYDGLPSFDERLAWAFAGTEVLRRLLGLAQLPLAYTLEERAALLRQASDRL